MGSAIAVLVISCAYALFLVFRVKSVFGTYFLILSGNNLFNANGIELNIVGLVFLWLIAIAGIVVGALLLFKNLQVIDVKNETGISNTKKCPKCAETIKLEAKVCKYCSNEFTDYDIETLKDEKTALTKLKSKRGVHHWSDDDSTHNIESRCPTCGDFFHGSKYTECTKCNCKLVTV